MTSDFDKDARENGKCAYTGDGRDDPCGLAEGWGYPNTTSGFCSNHGNRGAPPGNQRGMKTGVGSDPVNLFEYLKKNDPEAAAWILSKVWDYAQSAGIEVFVVDLDEQDDDFDVLDAELTANGDDLMQICVRDYARWRAAKRQLEEGLITTQERATDAGAVMVEDSNPVNLDLDRLDRTTMRLKKNNNLLEDPESAKADAIDNIGDLWADDLTD